MNVTRLAIRRPIAMLMFLLAIVILGVAAYVQLPVRRLPSVNFPHITVVLSDPGAGPGTIRSQLLDPVENALTKVGGIVTMTGTARTGNGRIGLRFPGGTDVNQEAVQVANVVNQMAASLPAGSLPPVILKADPNALPVMNVALYGSQNQSTMYNLASQTVDPALSTVPGVAAVNMIGGRPLQVNVTLQAASLEQYGLTLAQVKSAIATQNSAAPGGAVQQGSQTNPVQVTGQAGSLAQLGQTEVTAHGRMIPLADLGTIVQGYPPVTTLSHLNGKTAIGFVISVQSNANTLQTAQNVRTAIAQLQSSLPKSAHLVITGDVTTYTRQAMTATQGDLFLGILAAGIMILIWLHRLRMTFVVLLTIPTTLCATFLAMYAVGFSIDMISLLALGLLIGILVDDAIVVLESIERRRSGGLAPADAAYQGRIEIAGAAVAITLTDVVVYAPVAFMQGNIGQLFREFGLTIVFASLFSLFVSFTLTPLLAAHFVWKTGGVERRSRFALWWDARFERLRDAYERTLRYALRNTLLIGAVVLAAAAFDLTAVRAGWVPTTYTPKQNSSVLFVNAQMPVGTSIHTTGSAVDALAARIQRIPGVKDVFSTTGFGNGSLTAQNIGRLTVDLSSRTALTAASLASLVDNVALQIPGLKIQTSVPNALLSGGGGGGGALSVVLRGPSMSTLQTLSDQVILALQKIPGITNPVSTAQSTQPTLSLQVNPQAVAAYSLSGRSVGTAIHSMLQGSTASQYRPNPNTVSEPIVLQVSTQPAPSIPAAPAAPSTQTAPSAPAVGGQGLSLQQLLNLPIATSGGAPVTLGQVAAVSLTASPAKEQEYNRELSVQITANTGGQPLGVIAQETKAALNKLSMPAGFSYKFNGAIQQKARAFGPLGSALKLSILLIYMLLAALYESFLDPLAVIVTLPLALTGSLLGLLTTGVPLSLYAFIAIIMLTGLVAKNAILLIDYAKRAMRERNMAMTEALVEAGRTRLRPILMTTGTITLAMLPLALPLGAGASERMPMAVVLIGGMLSGTLLTLIVLPVVYLKLVQAKNALARLPVFQLWRCNYRHKGQDVQ
ncbi:MAG: efflux RND transporter permease subunit [Bacilli bacterium]